MTDYKDRLAAAGFNEIGVDPWRVYQGVGGEADGTFTSAFIRARKPQ